MLNLQAIFEREIDEFPVKDCVIEKIVELPEAEYKHFRYNLLESNGFISENADHMYIDGNRVYHCLLVLGKNQSEGVLVEAEGYDYARYASLLQEARGFVTTRLSELASEIVKAGIQNTSNASWTVYFDELEEHFNIKFDINNGIGAMLLDILAARPEMAEIEPTESGYNMTFYLDYCTNLDEKEKLSSRILDDVFLLKDLIRTPLEDFHLVHSDVDTEPATIVYLDSKTLTDEGKHEWSDILDTQIVRVFHGIYGIQMECTGVDPQRLADFSLMLAGYCPNEDYDRWIKDTPDSSGIDMKLDSVK